jgi:hypothetical protein
VRIILWHHIKYLIIIHILAANLVVIPNSQIRTGKFKNVDQWFNGKILNHFSGRTQCNFSWRLNNICNTGQRLAYKGGWHRWYR